MPNSNSVQASEYDEEDYDDTDDEDDDEIEKTCIKTIHGKEFEYKDDEDENKDNQENQSPGYNLEEEDERFDSEDEHQYCNNDINEYYKKHANQYDQDPGIQAEPLMGHKLNGLSLKPLNIQTNHSYLLDNTVSPRAQIYEINNELEKSKKENKELLNLYNNLKTEKASSILQLLNLFIN